MTTVEKPRKKMLVNLAHDLFAAGWDQQSKMWFVLGASDDEYLEYVGSFDMDPGHWLMHRAEEGCLREHVQGVVLCFESWTYSKPIMKALGNNRVSLAYKALIPPNEHPDGCDMRTLLLTSRDGTVMRAHQFGDNPNDVKVEEMDPCPKQGTTTGDTVVDYMRTMLGVAPINGNELGHVASMAQVVAQRPDLQAMMLAAKSEEWDSDQLGAELFLNMEPDVQRAMLPTMPDDIRQALEKRGFDFSTITGPEFEEVPDVQADNPGLPPG